MRPFWLINPKTNYILELDGYCEELKLAFEYQGDQHYRIVSWFRMTKESLKYQQEKDAAKVKLCKENDIDLIVIKSEPKDTIKKYILERIRKILEEKGYI